MSYIYCVQTFILTEDDYEQLMNMNYIIFELTDIKGLQNNVIKTNGFHQTCCQNMHHHSNLISKHSFAQLCTCKPLERHRKALLRLLLLARIKQESNC